MIEADVHIDSTITKDTPPGALSVARGPVNMGGWQRPVKSK